MFGRKREHGEMVPTETIHAMSPFEGFERLFGDVFTNPMARMPLGNRWFGEAAEPAVDIYEDGDNLVLKAEMPGMKREDIEIKLVDNVVTISGERKKEEKVEEKDYYRIERRSGSFFRSFRLPVDVKHEEIVAKFRNGMLELKLPKTDKAKNREFKVPIH